MFTVITSAYEALHHYLEESRVVLLHPHSRYRSVVIARLLNDEAYATFYYAFETDIVTVRAFVESFTQQLSQQNPLFGLHLSKINSEMLAEYPNYMEPLLQAFAADLNQLLDDTYTLVLDEYDHSDESDDIHEFLFNLIDILPVHCRIVINSRTMPRLPWLQMISKRQATVLNDNNFVERDFYIPHSPKQPDLTVYALGQSYVVYKGDMIDNWEGHLPKLLLFFALERPLVTRAEICSAFWPELKSDQAVNVFHVTKRRLHKALDMDVLVHTDSRYAINPDLNVSYDAEQFVESLIAGRITSGNDAYEAYHRAVRLYRGAFLQGHEDAWIRYARTGFRKGYMEAISAMASTWVQKGHQEQALRLYQQGLEEDFMFDDAHIEIMRLFTEMGRRSEAVAHYQKVERYYRNIKQPIAPRVAQFHRDITS